MGERCKEALSLDFDRKLKVEFYGTKRSVANSKPLSPH